MNKEDKPMDDMLQRVFDLEKIEPSSTLGAMIAQVNETYGLGEGHSEDQNRQGGSVVPFPGQIVELFDDDLDNIVAARKDWEAEDDDEV